MELGEKLRLARLEAGMSQRQLCGEEITRNMLSLIENGSAKPSMKTLQYLASRLGKSVSYFLEETAVVSPNQQRMFAARQLFDEGDYAGAAAQLEGYREPDGVFDRERQLLQVLIYLELTEQAIRQKRELYALELLEKANRETVYCNEELRRKWLLLAGQLKAQRVSSQLPTLDRELLLRAEEALAEGKPERAGQLLDAAEDQTAIAWLLLRGEVCLAQKDYPSAARFFHGAEGECPEKTAPKLEQCYRELGDFRRAYEYACKQR